MKTSKSTSAWAEIQPQQYQSVNTSLYMQQKTEQFSRQLAHILMPFISIVHSAEKKMKMLRERTAVSLKNELLENFFTETLGASKKKNKKKTRLMSAALDIHPSLFLSQPPRGCGEVTPWLSRGVNALTPGRRLADRTWRDSTQTRANPRAGRPRVGI